MNQLGLYTTLDQYTGGDVPLDSNGTMYLQPAGGGGIPYIPGVPTLVLTPPPPPPPPPPNPPGDIPMDSTMPQITTSPIPAINLPTGSPGQLITVNPNVPIVSETPTMTDVARSNNWLLGLVIGGFAWYAYDKTKNRGGRK